MTKNAVICALVMIQYQEFNFDTISIRYFTKYRDIDIDIDIF